MESRLQKKSSTSKMVSAISSQESDDNSAAYLLYVAIVSLLTWLCMRSALNLFTFNHRRFPGVAYLEGDFISGRYKQFSANHGNGTSDEVIKSAGELAKNNPKGMCRYRIFNKCFLLITQPAHIAQLDYQRKKYNRSEVVKTNFAKLFGQNIFTLPSGEPHAEQRKIFKKFLSDQESLKEIAPMMFSIIKERIKALTQSSSIELEPSLSGLALDVIAQTQLGSKSLNGSYSHFGHAFHDGMSKIYDFNCIGEQLLKDIFNKVPFTAFLSTLFGIPQKTRIEKAKEHLHEVEKEHLLKGNADKIQSTSNLLSSLSKLHNNNQLDSDEMLNNISFTLFAGHDTTSRLLQFSITLLALHPPVLDKLQKAIKNHRPNEGTWMKDDIEKIEYLDWVIKETLRLFPGAPILANTATEEIILADIETPTSFTHYIELMEKRDKSKDVILNPDEHVVISPYLTHRFAFENPEQFDPERFKDEKAFEPFKYFPFGVGSRACIGRNFAQLEAKMMLVCLIETCDFILHKGAHNPLAVELLGTIRGKAPVHMTFTPKLSSAKDTMQ